MSHEPGRLYAALVERVVTAPGVRVAAAFDEGTCLACAFGASGASLKVGGVIAAMRDIVQSADATSLDEHVALFEGELARVLVRHGNIATFVAVVDHAADIDLVLAHLSRAAETTRPRAPAPELESTLAAALPATGFPSSSASGLPSRAPRTSSGFFVRPSAHAPEAVSRYVDAAVLLKLRALVLTGHGFGGDTIYASSVVAVQDAVGVPRSRFLELVGRLASAIEDDEARGAFVEEAMNLRAGQEDPGFARLSPLARHVVGRRGG